MITDEKQICPVCGGDGEEVIGENRVSLDMAIDAGEPSMEGAFHSYAYGACSKCNGEGVTPRGFWAGRGGIGRRKSGWQKKLNCHVGWLTRCSQLTVQNLTTKDVGKSLPSRSKFFK